MKLLLFDVDATLVLTGSAGLRALNRAFADLYSCPNAMDGVPPHGKTDPGIVREVFAAHLPEIPLDDATIEKILGMYVGYLLEEVEQSKTYHVLPGIDDTLTHLSQRDDVVLGLATGNIEAGARIKLRPGNLNRFFAFGGFGSDSEYRVELVRRGAALAFQHLGRELPNHDVWVIGDTPRDIDAGHRAGFRTVGVATGQFTVGQLQSSGADMAIPDFVEGRDQFFRTTLME